MKKTLSKRIAARSTKRTQGSRARDLVAFLALHNEVKEAIEDGWSLVAIWEHLREEKKISHSYTSFLRYVKRLYVVAPAKREKQGAGKLPAVATSTSGGFKYNPNPKKEELI